MRQPSCKRGPRLGCINEASEAWRFFWGDTQPYPRPANAIDVPKTMRRDRSYLRYPTRRHQGSTAVLPHESRPVRRGALQGAPMEARTCGHIALTLIRPSENRVINRRGVTCGDATSVLDVLRGRPPGGNTYAGVRTRDSFVSPGNVGHVCAPGVMTACVGVRRHGKVSPGGHSGWRLTVWAKRRGGPHRPPPSAALPGRLTASLGKSSKSLGNYFHRSADQAAIQQLLSRATAPRTQSVSQMGSQRHHWLQAIAGAYSLRPPIPR